MTRIGRQRRWSAGVLALALSIAHFPALAQEGPIVVGQRQTPPRFALYDWRGSLEAIYRQREESRQPTGGEKQKLTEDHFEETITLESKGHIYHPNLVDLTLSGTFGLTQEQIDLNGDSQKQFGTIYEYDLNAEILRKEKAPVTLYTRRTQDQINRQFGPTLNNIYGQTGAIWDIRSERVPTRLEVYHSNLEQTGIAGDGTGDFTLTQNTFLWHSQASPRKNHILTWDYTLSEVAETTEGFSDNNYLINDAALTYSIDFGPNERHNSTTTLTYFNQSGDFPITRARADELLRFRHTDWFETDYEALIERQSYTGIDEDRARATAGFLHRVYKSLVTEGNIGVELTQRSDDSSSFEVFADLSMDYNKKVPFGKMNAFFKIGFDITENDDQANPIPRIDVPATFIDPAPIILPGGNIDPTSIRITDPSGLILYSPGADYTFETFRNRIEIDRVIGGRINDGSQVLIDYVIVPQPANTVTTNYFAFGGRYDIEQGFLRGVSIYGRFSRQDQNIDSDEFFVFVPNSFTDLTYGLEYRLYDLTLGAEWQRHDSTISPFNAARYFARYSRRVNQSLTVNLNTALTEADFLDEDNHVELFTVSGSVQWRITSKLNLLVAVAYRDEDDDQRGKTRGLEEQVELNWRYRQTTIYGLIRNTDFDSDTQDNSFRLIEFGLRREF